MTLEPVFLAPEPAPALVGTVIEGREIVAREAEALRIARGNTELLQDELAESLAAAEMAMEDVGWRRLTADSDYAFSRAGLVRAAQVARAMAVTNALIGRGILLVTAYVWGGGVQITAKATGEEDGEQDVNAVLQAFLDDEGNVRAVFGEQATEELERSLKTDGNVFVAAFTAPRTGSVQVRTIPLDEVDEVITNPEDRSEPWFYRRVYSTFEIDYTTGQQTPTQKVTYYPAIGYRPTLRPSTLGGGEVRWDAPVLHISVNRDASWKFGVGDVYAALPWARLYNQFLSDWAQLIKALSRFAFRLTAKGDKVTKAAAQLRQNAALAAGGSGLPGDSRAGATYTGDPTTSLEAIPKSGATIDSDSGRPLAAMVATGLGLPVTMILGDPGVSGARATAETLDEPTKLGMQQRQRRHTQWQRRLAAYVITESVRAPQGKLTGKIVRDEFGREQVTLDGDTSTDVEVTWPDLDGAKDPILARVQAINVADQTEKLPPRTIITLLCQALGVDDIDAVLEEMTDPETGEIKDPAVARAALGVQQALAGTDLASGQVYGDPAPTPAPTGKNLDGPPGGGPPST